MHLRIAKAFILFVFPYLLVSCGRELVKAAIGESQKADNEVAEYSGHNEPEFIEPKTNTSISVPEFDSVALRLRWDSDRDISLALQATKSFVYQEYGDAGGTFTGKVKNITDSQVCIRDVFSGRVVASSEASQDVYFAVSSLKKINRFSGSWNAHCLEPGEELYLTAPLNQQQQQDMSFVELSFSVVEFDESVSPVYELVMDKFLFNITNTLGYALSFKEVFCFYNHQAEERFYILKHIVGNESLLESEQTLKGECPKKEGFNLSNVIPISIESDPYEPPIPTQISKLLKGKANLSLDSSEVYKTHYHEGISLTITDGYQDKMRFTGVLNNTADTLLCLDSAELELELEDGRKLVDEANLNSSIYSNSEDFWAKDYCFGKGESLFVEFDFDVDVSSPLKGLSINLQGRDASTEGLEKKVDLSTSETLENQILNHYDFPLKLRYLYCFYQTEDGHVFSESALGLGEYQLDSKRAFLYSCKSFPGANLIGTSGLVIQN